MARTNDNGEQFSNFTTTRLDLATKLGLIACLLYGSVPKIPGQSDEEAAVEAAGKLVELCDKKAHWLKAETKRKDGHQICSRR